MLLAPIGFGANLNIDASKKKKARIIQPDGFKTKKNTLFQNKRFSTKKLNSGVILHRDSTISISTESPNDSINRLNGRKSRIDGLEKAKTSQILDQVVSSSDEFEKAFRNALTVELSKRAATQVEVKKTKAKLTQGDINRDSKVRRSSESGFNIQPAGVSSD